MPISVPYVRASSVPNFRVDPPLLFKYATFHLPGSQFLHSIISILHYGGSHAKSWTTLVIALTLLSEDDPIIGNPTNISWVRLTYV